MKKFLLLIAAAVVSCAAWAQNAAAVAGTYNCDLYLALGTPIDETTQPLPNMPVTIEQGDQEGTVNFALYNLNLGEGLALGDIKLDNIPLVADGSNYKFGENAPVRLSLMSGAIQADVNINSATSYIKGNLLYADVDIQWVQEGQANTPIYVRVTGPKTESPAVTSAFALPNPGFNGEWEECRPWDSANGYFDWGTLKDEFWSQYQYKRADFVQPKGWIVANVSGMSGLGATCVVKRDTLDAAAPDYAVTLKNTPNPFMASQIVPGYISLGTTWATIGGLDWVTGVPVDADGGAFGGVAFTSQPDAISLRYKRSHGTANATERASVIAYSWKGEYKQVEVPAQTAMAAPVKTTMYGRDRNILGIETTVGGEVTQSDDAQLVAKAEYYIEGDAADWTNLEVPFSYTEGAAAPDSLNVIISANDYFADRTLMGADNSLTIDDVKLVYWHALSALSYDGQALDLTQGNNFELNGDYNADKLAYTVKGRAAKATATYNETDRTLTIRVEAQNLEEDADAFTLYTLAFGKSTGINDATAPTTRQASGVYTLSGVRVADQLTPALPKGVYVVNGKKVVK